MLELLINYHADFENNGTTIRQLTVPQFKNYRLRVPSLDKQNTIISEVEYYESVITQNQSTIANLERQKGDVLNHNLLARIPKT
jgi:restriction endonuclease S subunit